MQEKIVVLSGAGMSAESGINTFRDADGLWEGHDVMAVASPNGWRANKELVLDFYNQRRRQLKEVVPNAGHLALVELEAHYDVAIVTQNVDDLHERAGSQNILHLHGELRKVRSTANSRYVIPWDDDCNLGDLCPEGYQLRPHIVWFGEDVPAMKDAVAAIAQAHHVIIVGTSMQVYPAAGLVHYAPRDARIYYIDPNPNINHELGLVSQLEVIRQPASTGVRQVVDALLVRAGG